MSNVTSELEIIRIYDWQNDIPFAIHAIKREPDWYCVDFKIYRINGQTADSNELWYEGRDGMFDDVADMSKATAFLEGYIKWDGCSDWTGLIDNHFCSQKEAMQIGEILKRAYDIAAELMPGKGVLS